MDGLQLLLDLHKDATRQGPGGEAESLRALALMGLDRDRPLSVADIGCGTGAASLLLAKELNAQVTAIDFLPEFLAVLQERAEAAGLSDRITTCAASMDALPFEDNCFDLIWSEGAVYNMGFTAGIRAWRRFLKPGGTLVVSEITWLQATRPAELEAYWAKLYPEMDTASGKISVLEQAGYRLDGYFFLQPHCWLDHYYVPLQQRYGDFLARHGHRAEAQAIVAADREEIQTYERFQDHYSYGVYVATRL